MMKHFPPFLSLTCTERGEECSEAGDGEEEGAGHWEEKQVERPGRQREQPVAQTRVLN